MNAGYKVAVVAWQAEGGIGLAIQAALERLGHEPVLFDFDRPVPAGVDVLFTFAPFARWLPIASQMAGRPAGQRPLFVHWSTEPIPSPRLPPRLVGRLAAARSWLGRRNQAGAGRPPLSWLDGRLHKFRFVGDQCYAVERGWLDLLVETSQVYAQLYRRLGVPIRVVPWGTVPDWYADLGLERDIDVLWMGKRRTGRRSRLLDRLRGQLAARGLKLYVADGRENRFLYGRQRIEMLNRAKITLNLLPTWWDNNFPFRFHLAAPNRSLVVSEPLQPHCAAYQAGQHYVAAPAGTLADRLLYYVQHREERQAIVENAYRLATEQMTFDRSVAAIMAAVERVQRGPQEENRT